MVELFCVLVGAAGNTFSVDIDASKSVGHLKKAIREENDDIKCAPRKLELYLAKKGDAWITNNEVKGVTDVIGLKHLDVPQAELGVVGLSEEEVSPQVDEYQVAAGQGPVHVLVVVPTEDGPIGLELGRFSSDNLLAFLESEMANKDATLSRPHILEADELQSDFVGQEEAIRWTARCFRNFIESTKIAGSDRTDVPIPVCSGMSCVGKTRLLEECSNILEEVLKVDRNDIVSVIVPYSKGFSPQPVEQWVPIEASFSWRLLYRVFLDKNCSLSLEEWFKVRLPRNGGRLTLERALEVVVRKIRGKFKTQRHRCTSSLALMIIKELKRSAVVNENPTGHSCVVKWTP